MKSNNKQVIGVALAALLMGSVAMAEEKSESGALDTSWLSVNGEMNLDYFSSSTNDYATNLRASDARLTLSAKISDNIKAVVTAQMSEMLRQNGVDVTGSQFDLNKFIREAYIEIKTDSFGAPIAVVVGKQKIPFAQNASGMPMYKDNLLYGIGTIDQVMGVTVRLDKNLLNFVDSTEVSVFENGAGDLKIADSKGFSIRVSKQITEKLKATGSWAEMKQPLAANDSRQSIGLVYDNGNGTWRAYAEGFHYDGATIVPNMDATATTVNPNSHYAGMAGAALHVGPGEVVVEYSILEKQAQQYALAYNLPVGHGLTVSPEVRRTNYDNAAMEDATTVGVRLKAELGPQEKAKKN